MNHTNETHPVPANERMPLPCGCHDERQPVGDLWGYLVYCKPDCQFHGKRIGRVVSRTAYVPFDAEGIDITRLVSNLEESK